MNCRRFVLSVSLLLLSLASSPAGTILRFHTTVGDIDAELFDADKPATVQNFLRYVQNGSYTNMIMHRVVTNFVIQGGGFNVANLGTPEAIILGVVVSAPVTNEIAVGRFYSNTYGTIAMAKTADPDSATSQFFFNLADNSAALNDPNNSGGFTVFGQVIAGTNVLNFFKLSSTNRVVKKANQGGALTELPVTFSADSADPAFDDLIYVDIRRAPAFAPFKGSYNGLVIAPDTIAQPVPGQVSVTTTARPKQKFSGHLRLGSARYSFTGSFDTNGYATVAAVSGKSQLAVELHADADRLVGTVSDEHWVANLSADRPIFGRTNPATAYAGTYTLALPGTNRLGVPFGHGFASIRVDSAGRVKVAGSLADGTGFSQAVTVAPDGRWPLYVPMYRDHGSISGWMTFTPGSGTNVHGRLRWRRPGRMDSQIFPGGFATEISAFGSKYTPPADGTPVLSLTEWPLRFTGGNLSLSFTDTVTLDADNKLTNPTPNPMTVTLALPSGLFKGSIKPPGSTRTVSFKGALIQNQNSGYGYFLGTDQSGRVSFPP